MRCVLIVAISFFASSLLSAEVGTTPADGVYEVVCSRTTGHVIAPDVPGDTG